MAEAPLVDALVRRYHESFNQTWPDDALVEDVRFVALDCETTGLNPRTDRIITIGAVTIHRNEILLGDTFEALLKVGNNTGAVTVHGVTRDESRHGMEEEQALALFLEYLKDGVIVGHHIGHDVASLNEACERHWGFSLRNLNIDTMSLTLHLERDGAFPGRPPTQDFSLDALCDRFGVIPHGRHTAGGDAFLTAQIFLRLLPLAGRSGRSKLSALCEPFHL